jgi:hypothetical protein
MPDDGLNAVAPVLVRVGVAPAPFLAGDVKAGQEGAFTATTPTVRQYVSRHRAGVQQHTLQRGVHGMAIIGIANQGLTIQNKVFFGGGHYPPPVSLDVCATAMRTVRQESYYAA